MEDKKDTKELTYKEKVELAKKMLEEQATNKDPRRKQRGITSNYNLIF